MITVVVDLTIPVFDNDLNPWHHSKTGGSSSPILSSSRAVDLGFIGKNAVLYFAYGDALRHFWAPRQVTFSTANTVMVCESWSHFILLTKRIPNTVMFPLSLDKNDRPPLCMAEVERDNW